MIAFQGAGNASVSGTAASPDQVTRPGRERRPCRRRWPTPPRTAPSWSPATPPRDWDDAPGDTSIQVFEDFAAQLGEAFEPGRRRAADPLRLRLPRGHHDLPRAPRTGLRLRHVQPTGHYGCTGKNAELTNSAWVGGATRDFADVDGTRMAADLATRLVLGRAPDRPARRALRHDPAADRGRRPDDRRLLERRRPHRRTTARRSSPRPVAAPGSASRWSTPAVRLHSRPVVRRTGVRPVRRRRRLLGPQQRLRQRPAARPDRLDQRRAAHLADPDPAHRRT